VAKCKTLSEELCLKATTECQYNAVQGAQVKESTAKVSASLTLKPGNPLLENNLVLIGLGAVIFILIFIVCCMLMKMRSNNTRSRGKSFDEVAGSSRFGSEMKDIYGGNDPDENNKRPSEMSLAKNESNRYGPDSARQERLQMSQK
jgi:hypothetical protein